MWAKEICFWKIFFVGIMAVTVLEAEEPIFSDDEFFSFRREGIDLSCNFPLARFAGFSASSSYGVGKEAENARFNFRSLNAWSPLQSDFNQFVLIDLEEPKHILAIVTGGRPNTEDFVLNYTISFGEKSDQMIAYVDGSGMAKVFQGNNDSISVHRNDLPNPIVARFVRINPRQWNHMIALRVELLGCDYATDVASFDGKSFLRIDLNFQQIFSVEDKLHFRFKTIQNDGLIIYSHGFQNDIFVLQFLQSRLLLTIGLGDGKSNTIQFGNAIDDGIWHSVTISRNERRVETWLDGFVQIIELENGFFKLNLEKELFIGGMNNLQKPFVKAHRNFQGCLERLRFNNTNIIWQLQHLNPPGFEQIGNIHYNCPDFRLDAMTFTTTDAFMKISSVTEQNSVNVSFCFRTYEQKGQILRKEFVDNGFVKVFLERDQLKLYIQASHIPAVTLEAFPEVLVNDGAWHCYALLIQTNSITQKLDRKVSVTSRILSFKPKPEYIIGGSSVPEEERGFRGCIRNLVTEGKMWDGIHDQQSSFVTVNECKMQDRCTPDPCRHGGRCYQTWDQFFCDCSQTGYGGAVCKTSSHPITCEEYRRYHPLSREAVIKLDLDGSGDLAPFPVLCKFEPDGRTEVHVYHDSMEESVVDGFQTAASFVQNINYNATWSQIIALINQSHTCRQNGKYSCRNSKLLNTPNGPPFGFWVSRSSRRMESWAGVFPGTVACMCALTESCYDRTRGCNCDADDDALRQDFLVDEGWFGPKDYLPVRQLVFGDTGSLTDSKESRYQLGPLICEGSYLMDNAVTFWRQDATLTFQNFDFGEIDGDIYFQFRTTVESGTFLHSKGETDELKIVLLSPTELQFLHSSENGPKTVSIQTTHRLNDNEWHSVLVERNRKESRIRVDGNSNSNWNSHSDSHSNWNSKLNWDSNSNWNSNSDFNWNPKSNSNFRFSELNRKLIVGASIDLSNGYVGCLRSLMVNGITYDLRFLVEMGTYGIVGGCVGKCDSSPCFNNGVCLERYDQYRCDCRFTAFRGPLCSDEIGAHFRAEDMVEYDFANHAISTVAERIRVGFLTSEPRGILLQVNGATGDYLTIEMSNAGTVRVAFDLGFERQEIYEESENYANGQFHDVVVWRTNNGRTVNVQVDDHEIVSRTYRIESKQDTQLNSVKTIYLGRNYSMNGREGFIGCLSRISFEDFFILKQLFQQNPPANAKANRRLREDWCDVQPATHPEEILPPRPDMLVPYAPVPTEIGSQSLNGDYEIFLGVLLAAVVMVVTACGVLLARCYVKRNRRLQKQKTERSKIMDDLAESVPLTPSSAGSDDMEGPFPDPGSSDF